MDHKLFNLDCYLPYLLNRAGGRIAEAFERELEPFGISLRMWRVLAALWHYEELTQIDLASQTSIDASTLSRMVATLARRQLVARAKSKTDSRAVTIRLTQKGREMTQALIPKALACEQKAQANLSPADILKLQEVLRQVFKNLEGI
jgi:DNA-binding MarR family transcriptional regulator